MKKVFPKKNIVIRNILSNLKGEGVLEDTPYSFPYTNIGDEVIFEERGRGKRKHFVVSAIIRKKEIQPKCSHFTHCGGCAGQHFSYEEQFELKTNFYKEKIFNEFSITPILISANKEYNYRNRMDFAVFPGKIVGLHQAGNFRKIIDIEHCHLQNDFANNELTKFKNTLHNFPEIIYNRKTEEGFLKYITFRRGVFSSDNIAILTFVKGFENTNEFTKLKSAILQSLESKNIVFCFNRKKAEVSASGEFIAIRGNHFYEEILFEKVFKIPLFGVVDNWIG
ncbi:MAG: hypothetical protein HUU45_14535 [Leptospiraceae bacterium]|nr:hypothetical protein [Leptospiraceae bacterium]